MKKIANTLSTRRANQLLILEILRENTSASPAFISRKLNVPIATITRVAEGLRKARLIKTSVSRLSGKVGKPPFSLEVNDRFAALAGVELNELVIRAIVTDFQGRLLSEHVEKTIRSHQRILTGQLPEVLQKTLRKAGTACPPLKWLSIGISGIIEPGTNIMAKGFLPHGNDIASAVSRKFNVPVSVENDANLAAIAEHTFGASRNYLHVVSLLDRGWLGSGIIIDGKPHYGKNHAAGELLAHARPLRPNKKGQILAEPPFIESFGLERRIREEGFKEFKTSDFDSRSEMIMHLASLAENGNRKAKLLLESEADNFAVAILRLSFLFDPELIVLQGDIASAGMTMEEKIRSKVMELYRKYNFTSIPPEIKFSNLSQLAVCIGAISVGIGKLTGKAI